MLKAIFQRNYKYAGVDYPRDEPFSVDEVDRETLEAAGGIVYNPAEIADLPSNENGSQPDDPDDPTGEEIANLLIHFSGEEDADHE